MTSQENLGEQQEQETLEDLTTDTEKLVAEFEEKLQDEPEPEQPRTRSSSVSNWKRKESPKGKENYPRGSNNGQRSSSRGRKNYQGGRNYYQSMGSNWGKPLPNIQVILSTTKVSYTIAEELERLSRSKDPECRDLRRELEKEIKILSSYYNQQVKRI